MDFISNHLVLVLIILGAIIFAVIGYIAEKKGYLGKKKDEGDLIDFDELSKPKDTDNKAEEVVAPKHEENLSRSFDEMPDFNSLPTVEENKETTEEVKEEISDELYAPFGDQTFDNHEPAVEDAKSENKDDVGEVVGDDFKQSFVDVDKIVSESKDIKNEEDKIGVVDLMQEQGNMDYDFTVEGAEDSKSVDANTFETVIDEEKDKKEKEEEELKNMWNY